MKKNKINAAASALILILIISLLAGCGKAKDAAYKVGEVVNEIVEAFTDEDVTENTSAYTKYTFRNSELLQQHFEKHGIEMGFDSPEEYEKAAGDVINNPNALTKTEEEDGDFVYYVEDTNEFVILSTDGYIRTYFLPDAGKSYFERQ